MSPLLFNIYTAGLHSITDNHIKIVQYADDFCLYCIIELKYIIYRIKTWSVEHSFEVAPEKCAIMFFAQKRLKLPKSLTLCKLSISVTTHYKYLGIYLDMKLTRTKHVSLIQSRCEKELSMLRWRGKNYMGMLRQISFNACN